MKAVLASVLRRCEGRTPALFLDFDGTLAPIVERPQDALLGEPTRSVLHALARRVPLAVVSGRDLADVRARIAISGVYYAGSHGFDIEGPGLRHQHPRAQAAVAPLHAAAAEIGRDTAGIAGVQLDPKRFALAVHYRRVTEEEVPAVRAAVEQARSRHPELRQRGGKKVFELLPDIGWDKGRAVLWLLRALRLDRDDVVPIYIGDDLTDEDAFRALAGRGIGIAVQQTLRPTAARFLLRNPRQVRAFLLGLCRSLGARRLSASPGASPERGANLC